jgi:hypothetical protein
MNKIYCGNNAHHPGLINGTKALGTRYSCLQKGKNNGLNQPVDPNFLLPYQPIDTTRKYCGKSDILPIGYDRFGGLYECYLSGVGVGKRLKATGNNIENYPSYNYSFKYNGDRRSDRNNDRNNDISNIGLVIYILGFSLFFIGMYYGRPSIITYSDPKDGYKDKINWTKFILFLLSFAVLYGVLVFFYIFK